MKLKGEFVGGSAGWCNVFVHNLPAWNRLNVSRQEKVVGQNCPDSIELDDVPAASHVGRIKRRRQGALKLFVTARPTVHSTGDHGLLFIAYCNVRHNHFYARGQPYGDDGKQTNCFALLKQ
ncbi:Dyp-type peroxidase [Vibrio lentus]|nr:Dyp-type peroxidase [Vibrio lentus]